MSYRINKTNPFAENAIINVPEFTSNGPIHPLSPVVDATGIAANSSLIFYGKGHPNYGERLSENILHVLENFSGSTEPSFAINGQQWNRRIDYVVAQGNWFQWNLITNTWDAVAVANGTPNTLVHGELYLNNNILSRVVNEPNNPLSPTTIQLEYTNTTIFSDPNTVGFLPEVSTMEYNNGAWRDVGSVTISTIEPTNPDQGKVWYDSGNGELKIFVGTTFVGLSGAFLSQSGGMMFGDIDMANNTLINLLPPINPNDAATKDYVDTAVVANSIMSSNIEDLSNVVNTPVATDTLSFLRFNDVLNVWQPSTIELSNIHDVNTAGVTITEIAHLDGLTTNIQNQFGVLANAASTKLPLSGGTMSGDIDLGNNTINNVVNPAAPSDVSNKAYVDQEVNQREQIFMKAEGAVFTAIVPNTLTVVDETTSLQNNVYTSIIDPNGIFELADGAFNFSLDASLGDNSIPSNDPNVIVEISLMVRWSVDNTAGSWRKIGLDISPNALGDYEDIRENIVGQSVTNIINTGPVKLSSTSVIKLHVEHSAATNQDLSFFALGIKVLDKSVA